ncbi:hypothetical protein [Sinorhizobium meliloti]|uniref:hypothetical protein n=1 Tax=Rhizobium meliloti TaxID=382 RepID=UPI00398CADE8
MLFDEPPYPWPFAESPGLLPLPQPPPPLFFEELLDDDPPPLPPWEEFFAEVPLEGELEPPTPPLPSTPL